MTEAIIVAVFSLAGNALGVLAGLRLMTYRIEQLEKKVEVHNNFAARMPVIEEQIKVINHRLNDLERGN